MSDLLETRVTGSSPFAGITSLDLRPLVETLDGIPVELTERAAAALDKKNPAHLTGADRFFYHPRSKLVGLLGCAGDVGGGFLLAGGETAAGAPILGGGLAVTGTWLWFLRRTSGYAGLEDLRAQALVISNPGIEIAHEDRAPADRLQREFGLRKGDRSIWVDGRYRIHGGDRVHGDLEMGAYCYETKHTNDKGQTSYSTHRLPYVFVPMPPDLRARGGAPFRVEHKGLIGKGDVSLSGAFDREFKVRLAADDEAGRMFVTRVLAPDVQQLLLRYGAQQEIDVRVGARGVWCLAEDLGHVLREHGHHSRAEGAAFVRALFRALHIVHEMFEQLDPAYKIDRETQNAILRQAGLEPVG